MLKYYPKKSLIILIFVALILIAVSVLLLKLANDPAQGNIVFNQPKPAASTPSFVANPISVKGKYISFSYPNEMTVDTNNVNSGATLSSYIYKYKDTPESWVLAISVNKLPEANIDEDSNYAIRKNSPTVYTASTYKVGKNTFIVMKDNQTSDFSSTAFILNGDDSADISLQGNDLNGLGNLQQTFELVLNSFKWQ